MSELRQEFLCDDSSHTLQISAKSRLARFLRRNSNVKHRSRDLYSSFGAFMTVDRCVIESIMPQYLKFKLKNPTRHKLSKLPKKENRRSRVVSDEESLERLQKELDIANDQAQVLHLSNAAIKDQLTRSTELSELKTRKISVMLMALANDPSGAVRHFLKDYFPNCDIELGNPLASDSITEAMHFVGKKLYIEGVEGSSPFDCAFKDFADKYLLKDKHFFAIAEESQLCDKIMDCATNNTEDLSSMEFEFNFKLNSCSFNMEEESKSTSATDKESWKQRTSLSTYNSDYSPLEWSQTETTSDFFFEP